MLSSEVWKRGKYVQSVLREWDKGNTGMGLDPEEDRNCTTKSLIPHTHKRAAYQVNRINIKPDLHHLLNPLLTGHADAQNPNFFGRMWAFV